MCVRTRLSFCMCVRYERKWQCARGSQRAIKIQNTPKNILTTVKQRHKNKEAKRETHRDSTMRNEDEKGDFQRLLTRAGILMRLRWMSVMLMMMTTATMATKGEWRAEKGDSRARFMLEIVRVDA